MIAMQERAVRHDVFQSIRSSIQELHADKVILEDANGAPFIFKSNDAQIWARIFYRSMTDFSLSELQQEIKKLWVLMPDEAVLYLFFPELDRQRILEMSGFSDRLSFFEYAGRQSTPEEKACVRIRKWIPSWVPASAPSVEGEGRPRPCISRGSFLESSRLTPQEISGLVELSLALHRA